MFRLASLAVAAMALAPASAHAVLLAEDHFLTSATPGGSEYSASSIAGQNPTTVGFSGPWFSSVGSSPTVNATSLNYTDALFPAETGGRMLSPTDNSRIHRSLSASNPFESSDSGTVYLSFLLVTGTNNGYRAFEMHNGGNDDAANRTLQIGLSSFGDFPSSSQFGFRVNNNGAFDFQLGAENANVHLFLVKFVLSTTNNADAITVWNNPSLASLVTDPTGGVTATGFNFAADRLGAGHFTGNTYGFDELRIGTSLADVLSNSLSCDINGNGVCNSTDIGIISDHMYLPGTFAEGDVDQSGFIDFSDYRLFKDHPARIVGFDAPGGGSGNAPEPASGLLLCIASLCCLSLARRAAGRRMSFCLAVLALAGVAVCDCRPVHAAAQDLLNDTLPFSGKTLDLRPYVTLPAGFNDIISMTTRPGDTRLYVTAQEGTIFAVNTHANGSTSASSWFDARSAVQAATGRTMFGEAGHDGLQSTAFHPDFATVGSPGYGKLYTTFMENPPPSPVGHKYLGSTAGGGEESVLVEWTYNHETSQVDPLSYRELFRAKLPVQDHKIKQARFNPYSEPGDDDYGLLYLTHGDASSQHSTEDRPQLLDNIFGKVLRINPLQSGGDNYSIPDSNPFFNDGNPSVLEEIYAYGFRNPHNFSFNQDDLGNVHMLVGDIGRNNIEEVNLVVNGGNYGWTEREGTFVHLQGQNFGVDAGYFVGVTALPANEDVVGIDAQGTRYSFPVAQYDHNGPTVAVGQDFLAVAIASGHVIRNGSDPALHNQLIFNNFGGNVGGVGGPVYHTDFDAMLNAVTQLDPDDPARDDPSELTQAFVQRMHLALDHDNNPNTAPQMFDDFSMLVGGSRNDARYGEGLSGEMYISNKINNVVYLVTNTVPDNLLTLTVDRGTGAMTITNSTGSDIDVDSVSVFSPSGSLDPVQFQALDMDWTVSGGNSPTAVNQANGAGSLLFTDTTIGVLGDAYDAQLIAFGEPAGEDLQLLFSTAGPNGRNFVGDVEYVGVSIIPTTVVLTIDVASGEASMLNQTPFTQEVEGYTISSESGALDAAGWNTLEDQGVDDGDWLASPGLATRLTEFQEDGTTTFDELTPFSLGEILADGGEQDLVFEFLLAGEGALREGQVKYILAGDYNGDDVVDSEDYTVWRDNLGGSEKLVNDMTPNSVSPDDFDVWKKNFGEVLPGAGGGAAANAVPEPTLLAHFYAAAIALVAAGFRRRTNRR